MGVAGGLAIYSIIRPMDMRITLSLGISLFLLIIAFLTHIHLSLIGPIASRYSAETAIESLEFKVAIIAALLGGILGLLTFKIRSRYMSIAAAIASIIAILALRLAILGSGAWEYPII
ncbi:MAG: hypothetical protein QXQ57_02130 [Sulfolobales archaeon]